ncbi:hypothetical protein Goarm_018783, partial [Gossypium armourianum]|nr:hypothetical protein [Gossypium armourianum]
MSQLEFMDWFTWVLLNSRVNVCRMFVCAIWAIWTSRSQWIHEGRKKFGAETEKLIKQYIHDLIELDRKSLALSPNSDRWRPPQQEFFKINFDAAFDIKENRSCSGIIVKNFKGDILAFNTTVYENIPSLFAAEAIAYLLAITVGKDLGIMHVVIEGDSLTVDTYLLELDMAQVKLLRRLVGVEWWQPPGGYCLKINFDADFHSSSKTSCAGVVIRNRYGIVLGSHIVVYKHIPSTFVALPTTCLHAVRLGLALGFSYVIVEGDSLTVLRKVQSSRPDPPILGAYIQDIKCRVGCFRKCDFQHVLRVGNTVADLLAKEGLKVGIGSYMCEGVLDFVKRAVECDCLSNFSSLWRRLYALVGIATVSLCAC